MPYWFSNYLSVENIHSFSLSTDLDLQMNKKKVSLMKKICQGLLIMIVQEMQAFYITFSQLNIPQTNVPHAKYPHVSLESVVEDSA